MLRDVPVIISRQSGVSEILHDVLKVNFVNIRELADKIISVLRLPALFKGDGASLPRGDTRDIHWENAAERIVSLYKSIVQSEGGCLRYVSALKYTSLTETEKLHFFLISIMFTNITITNTNQPMLNKVSEKCYIPTNRWGHIDQGI